MILKEPYETIKKFKERKKTKAKHMKNRYPDQAQSFYLRYGGNYFLFSSFIFLLVKVSRL